jgi:hypothetical protein
VRRPGLYIEGDQERFPAGSQNNPISLDQGALPGIPVGNGCLEIAHQIPLPLHVAHLRIGAKVVAFRAERNNVRIGDRRNGARHAMIPLHNRRIRATPDLRAVRQRETAERILFQSLVIVQQINAAITDRRCRIAFSYGDRPQPRWALRSPLSGKREGFHADAIAIFAAITGPPSR